MKDTEERKRYLKTKANNGIMFSVNEAEEYQSLLLDPITDTGTTVIEVPDDFKIFRSDYSGNSEFVGYARDLMKPSDKDQP